MLPTVTVTFGTPAADVTCDVMTASIIHGRDDPFSQPSADTATFDIWGPIPLGVTIATRAQIVAHHDGVDYPRFTGTVTDIAMAWETPETPVVQIIAAGAIAVMGRKFLGAAAMPAQLDGERALRLINGTPVPTDEARCDIGTIMMCPRPADTRDFALNIAHEACESGGGTLWQAKDGVVLYADAAHRDTTALTLALDPCHIPLELNWVKNLEGLVNDVFVTYCEQGDPVETTAAYGTTPTLNIGTTPDTCRMRIRLDTPINLGGIRVQQAPSQTADHWWHGRVLAADLTVLAGGPETLVPGPMIPTVLPVEYPLQADTDYWIEVKGSADHAGFNDVGSIGISAQPFIKWAPFVTPAAGDAFVVTSVGGTFPDSYQLTFTLMEQPEMEQAEAHVWDDVSMATYGTYALSMKTSIMGEGDAITRGAHLLHVQAEPAWRLTGVGLHLELMSKLGLTEVEDAALTAAVLALEIHDLVSIVGMPYASPIDPTYLFIEGWTESIAWGSWQLELAVSDYCQTASAETWDEVDPLVTWDTEEEYADATWDDMACPHP